jgi:hypothetical protein
VSIDIKWTIIARQVLGDVDATNGYQGDFLETNATIVVSVQNASGFSFSGSGDALSGFAETGHGQTAASSANDGSN